MVQRVISGVVLRETDPVQSPLRKMSGSGFASVMIAVVALAGAALIGIFFPSGNSTWQEGGKVIVEEETGATFVWLPNEENEQLLYPTVNFASAALLVGTTQYVNVSHKSLLEVPRGPRLGILDAPDSLPNPELMLQGGWTLCSLPARETDGGLVPSTALVVGRDITEGTQIEDKASLVEDVTLGTLHLIWNGHQFPIKIEHVNAVREALILQSTPSINVGTAWLSAVPRGEFLQPSPVSGRGEVSRAISDGIVGEIRKVEGGGRTQYYQVDATRIIEITEVQARMLLADDTIRDSVYRGRAPEPRPLSADEAQQADRVDLDPPAPTDPPANIPEVAETANPNPTICASFGDDEPTPRISVDAAVEGAENANATRQQTESGTVLADRVLITPGHGAIVQGLPSDGADSGVRYLVTDEGRAYPLPSAEAQGFLGYGSIEPVRLPSSLIARIPQGSALDPLEAQRPVA